MRSDCRKLNLRSVISKISKIEKVEEVYIFGSRAYGTGSVRSDIDLLIYAPNGRIEAEIADIMKSEKWLDVFYTSDKKQAISLVNSSIIKRDNLIKKLDAICLWKRKSKFTNEINSFNSLLLLRDYDPMATRLPIYSEDEQEFYNRYGHGAVFVIMPFAKTYDKIYKYIKEYLGTKGITAIRADDYKFNRDLWPNVELYLECCKMAIVLFPYDDSKFNPNVALELGYMLSKGGKICLLKENQVKMFSDVSSIMYNTYKERSYKRDISKALDTWIANGYK